MKKTIRWFLDLYDYGQLDLNPPYQRRSVWTLNDRRFFLDTVFKHFPCPAIFLYQKTDRTLGKMIYHVVDGKQRLETLISFRNNKLTFDKGYSDKRLNGQSWSSIENESDLIDRFLNYSVPVEFIEVTDDVVINEIFDRLNRNSRKLERQELRHAKFDGWFISLAEAEAVKDEWEQLGIITKAMMRRMKDVQYISELLIVLMKNRIIGYDQNILDDVYAEYDSPHESVDNFDEREFTDVLESVKTYILQMEQHNKTITRYAKGFSNFYSLWSFVILNRNHLPLPEVNADRYAEFMEKVTALAKVKDIKLLREYEEKQYANSYIYLKNSVQANSTQTRRVIRNTILENVLLHENSQAEALSAESEKTVSLSQNYASIIKSDHGERILKFIMGKTDSTNRKT
jgi:hypothetical protein